MRLLVLSDLHVEFAPFHAGQGQQRIDQGVDVVILAGDIHVGAQGLVWARQTFPDKPIVYVPGNHELYDGHWHNTLDRMREQARVHEVHLLENDRVCVEGVQFLGTTLWTDFELFGAHTRDAAMAAAKRTMVDYRAIAMDAIPPDPTTASARYLEPMDTLERHRSSRAWLDQALQQADPARTVVITHHYPSFQSTAPMFQKDLSSAAFGSDLEHWMGRAALWVHGHTHSSFDYALNGTRVVCNPRGYPLRRQGGFENPDFNACFAVDVAG
jgi:predicted phosphodiesterase